MKFAAFALLASSNAGRTVNVAEYGAVGDGSHDDTKTIQAMFDNAQDGDKLTFPQSAYLFGPVIFQKLNKVTIDFGNAHFEMKKDSDSWEGCSKMQCVPWIRGQHSQGITIKGGTFEGNHDYWQKLPNKKKTHNPRPYMMQFSNMDTFTASGMTLKNSPHTHFKVAGGSDVTIHDMTLTTDKNTENTDGIMLASVKTGHVGPNVHIQNGDDCLKANDGCQDVTFDGGSCTGSHGLSIGGGSTSLTVKNIIFKNFVLKDMSNGARIKFTTKTTGYIKDVHFEDLTMTNVDRPIHLDAGYQSLETALNSTAASGGVEIGDIYYKGITGKSCKYPGEFRCTSSSPCPNLHLDHVNIGTSNKWIFDGHANGEVVSVKPDGIFNGGSPSPPKPSPDSRRRKTPTPAPPTPSPDRRRRRRRKSQTADILV